MNIRTPAAIDDHGGSLERAARLFPRAQQPWIDLSTGINPHAWPVPALRRDVWRRLPEPGDDARLRAVAATAFGAPSAGHVVAAPGTQILLPMVMALRPSGTAAVLGPTYAEHRRTAALAGHEVIDARAPGQLEGGALAVVVNPNNPDGRVLDTATLLAIATRLERSGGLLIVDEAFIDASDQAQSLAGHVDEAPLVVLRSFGKFHGLAGLRLGFAIAAPALITRLSAGLGPWAVSGPALSIGAAAISDAAWAHRMRKRLAGEAARMQKLLAEAQLADAGGCNLFRLVRTPQAPALFAHLASHGLWARNFDAASGVGEDAVRIGLPPDKAAWGRLGAALAGWRG